MGQRWSPCKLCMHCVTLYFHIQCTTLCGTVEEFGLESQKRKVVFRLVRNIQPYIYLVSGTLSAGVKCPVREADSSPCLVLRCRCVSSPHGIVLNSVQGRFVFVDWHCATFTLDFVFSHVELHAMEVFFSRCRFRSVIFQLCKKKITSHFLLSFLWYWYNEQQMTDYFLGGIGECTPSCSCSVQKN